MENAKMKLLEIKTAEENRISSQLRRINEKLAGFIQQRIKKLGDSKAIQDITRQVTHAFALTDTDVDEFIKNFHADKIFNSNVLITGGNLFDNVTPEYTDLAKELFHIRSFGLGTPNAASGEGELMCLILSPTVSISKKKNKGDLEVNGKLLELKGWAPRLFAPVTGKQLNDFGLKLCQSMGYEPNLATKGRPTVEPWDTGKKSQHWKQEFSKKTEALNKKFLFELMNATGAKFSHDAIARCFDGKTFNPSKLQLEILKSFFAIQEPEWDYLTNIEGGHVAVIPNNAEEFSKMVDAGKVIPTGNFFRMFQALPVGWYYKLNS